MAYLIDGYFIDNYLIEGYFLSVGEESVNQYALKMDAEFSDDGTGHALKEDVVFNITE